MSYRAKFIEKWCVIFYFNTAREISDIIYVRFENIVAITTSESYYISFQNNIEVQQSKRDEKFMILPSPGPRCQFLSYSQLFEIG